MFRSFYLVLLAMVLMIQPSFACKVGNYLKSPEGQQKLESMLERSKSLIISKLEDLGFEEKDILITAKLPKDFTKLNAVNGYKEKNMTVSFKSEKGKKYKIWGESIYLNKIEWKGKTKTASESVCGVSINFNGGYMSEIENSKEFGNLGQVKEFVRLD